MPAATRAGTIEGVAPGLKQLLASLSQTAHVVIFVMQRRKGFSQDKAIGRGNVSRSIVARIRLC
ncbi:hypothetical protein ACVWZZ_006175 [Bradyrhizobium sp. LM6.10]